MRVAPLIALLTLTLASAPALPEQEPERVVFPDPDVGVEALERRREAQLATADELRVRHDFRFEDRLPGSGIAFRHRVVEDAAEEYTAAHYDHGNGLGVADVDGDGLPDLYFVNQLGANELWRNRGDGTFEEITEAAGVGLADRISVAPAFADIDNDGDPDLFVSTVRMGNVLFENDGEGRFRDISEAAGVDYVGHSSGAVFVDFDADGLLDLLVTNVGTYTSDERGPGGFYRGLDDAFDGHLVPERFETSILYRNQGDRRFRDVSEEVGLVDDGWTGDAALVDLDADAEPDLYLLNMQGSDHYWVNDAGTFTDRTREHFPRSPYGTMGIQSFDHDLDGHLDLLLTDMHSDMNQAQSPDEEEDKQPFQQKYFYQRPGVHILGNAFWRNDGDGGFTEISDEIGLENYWPWGASAGDVNADGREDVFIASSMNYPFRYGINTLRLNTPDTGFAPAEFILGVEPRRDGRVRAPWFELDCAGEDDRHVHCQGRDDRIVVMGTLGSRTSALVDLDEDGDLDLVTGDFNSVPQLLISDLAQRHDIRWLKVRLEGTDANRDGLGARVTVHVGDRRLTQLHDGKTGYLSQGSVALYFGLGDADSIDRVVVRWPFGDEQVVQGPLEPNRVLRIRQPESP